MALSHYGVLENVCPTYEERLHTVGYAELFNLLKNCDHFWAYRHRIHNVFNVYITYEERMHNVS